SASPVVMGAVVVGPTPPAYSSLGPAVPPAADHTGGQGRGGCFLPRPSGRGLHARDLITRSDLVGCGWPVVDVGECCPAACWRRACVGAGECAALVGARS